MRIVLTLAAVEDDVFDAQVAFHLHAGVDLVLVRDTAVTSGLEAIAVARERQGQVRRVALPSVEPSRLRHELARAAMEEYGAEWIIDAEPGEFWWPRGESLQDVLVAIPPRYGVVQGLMRTFAPQFGGGGTFDERMTARDAVRRERGRNGPRSWLRPMFRAGDMLELGPDGAMVSGLAVPLRAWYPLEVLRFPLRDAEQAERRLCGSAPHLHPPRTPVELRGIEAVGSHSLDRLTTDPASSEAEVVDRRVHEALASIRVASTSPPADSGFLSPSESTARLFVPPDIVVDAAFAAECAEVGEVDLEGLERQIKELQQRLAALEHPLWPRVRRRIARLVRR